MSLAAGDYELWLQPGTVSKGHYTFELDREDPWAPTTALPATVSVTTPTEAVAAYWQAGQHLDGQVTLTNTSAVSETLDLDVATSHYAWMASLGQEQVSLAAAPARPCRYRSTCSPTPGQTCRYASACGLARREAHKPSVTSN